MNKPAGVAFIGAGFISYLHLFAVRSNPNLKLLAIASQSKEVAEHRARIFDAAPYTFSNLGDMLARKDIDIVFVLSPNSLHAEHALAAIRAGKHLVIEKPLAITLAEAKKVTETATAAGVSIGYAENQVYSPLLLKAREMIADGALGAVKSALGFCGHGGPPPNGWFRKPQFAGGGAHLDLGSHTLESVLFLTGKPPIKRVKSCVLAEAPDGGIDGKGEAVLETKDGVEITCVSSWLETEESFHYEVQGEKGRLRAAFSPPPQFLTFYHADGEVENIDIPAQFDMRLNRYLASGGYVGQVEDFERCFRTGEIPMESALDGERVLRILTAGYLSAREKRPLDLTSPLPMEKTPIQIWLGT
ncbi:MAG: gfo/Idh/MocA family oxidoreductase [Candidatus Abyssobacteria bacterium SURF_5]|uniref:Gfo/Idh/MocA family oxidoreductase n=1 Tax=Abyssobacteria bacterium (strain SURF_5) TaxID=2093360 RepID=A0A3A4N842_ABYX5|nr:MAG: gfo/Idh/MocA family oxidoreductase [Candidatus Abyssubacteria bacterium SURF_5]